MEIQLLMVEEMGSNDLLRTNTETAKAQNASFTVDGVSISNFNEIVDVIDGQLIISQYYFLSCYCISFYIKR